FADDELETVFPSFLLRSLEDDLAASWHRRQPLPIESLLADVPPRQQGQVFFSLLLVELTWRQHAGGEPPAPAQYLARFPDFADEITAAFHDLASRAPTAPPDASSVHHRLGQPANLLETVIDPVVDDVSLKDDATGPPTMIGRFRVLRRLGRGGFGDVYLAHDPALDREVAIKVPKARALVHLGQQWVHEARVVAQLDHPHIVPVYEVGSAPGVPAFIVSKFIDGCTLAQRLKQAALPPAEAVGLVIDVALALDFAHRYRSAVVHRDIKPGNLLLDREGCVHVADFGLAIRELDLSEDQSIAGTPAYMSPEQFRGEGHCIDSRSDIFSLGVVLYELLTGRRPFRGNDLMTLWQQVTQCDPTPPQQINVDLSPELERICLKALAKLATDRYQSARDLASDLRLFQASTWGTGPRELSPPVATPQPPLALPPAGVITPTDSKAHGTQSDRSGPETGGTTLPEDVKIVPKGLRSYDAGDAGFFLGLLPGPRDRDGLPESLRFWKQWIEPNNDLPHFTVALLCGPSGSGKSSLIKAGLLPRLSPDVL
ncbi:MAG: protein kinase domain-containing protein, partial [Planctomycetaceae bacterium]